MWETEEQPTAVTPFGPAPNPACLKRLPLSSLPQHTTSMGTLVLWGTPDVAFAVPLWVIILAILLGLLVLAMLTLAMWKCGFFDRARPPVDDVSDREQLTSDQSADA
ncbi:hypothetical protein J4Q44_G00386310 [Coregonus suidteri]|uniref:Uncharacterized protein n=1 Tax=Coregonus suidteri TaxID=861788 RepID=A0AAN8KL17_9TELE